MTTRAKAPLPNLWRDSEAEGLDEPGLLLYRSNLLGSDLRITNFGGGNTSAKVRAKDPLSQQDVTVLWVKGSGGDIGSMKRDGFSTLYMDKLIALKGLYRGLAHEDAMVALFEHCTFNLNPRATSIDTSLHAFVPHVHVDHVHADSVIAIAASINSEALTKQVYGGEIGYLPWQRPGFDLGLKLGEMATKHPEYVGVVLGGHGLFTWGPTSKTCYETTLRIIQKAADWLEATEAKPAFSGARCESLAPEARRAAAARLLPVIRGKISSHERKVGHFPTRPKCSPSSIRRRWRRSRRSAPPAPIISCARRSARSCCRFIPRPTIWMRSSRDWTASWRPIAPITPPITIAASAPIRQRCAIPTR